MGQAVWLHRDGAMINFLVCLPEASEVEVEQVTYSSDGWEKTAVVRVDSQQVCKQIKKILD